MTGESIYYVDRGPYAIGPTYKAEADRLASGVGHGTLTDHKPNKPIVAVGEPLPAAPVAEPDDGVLPPIDALSDDWDILQMAGLQASEGQERRRWYLGALAGKVVKRYGQKSLAKFAGDIKIPRAKTLYDYHRTFAFYGFSAHAEFPTLTWSHFREAMKAREYEDAMDWLGKAADMNWTVVQLGQAIDKAHGKTVHVKHSFDVVCISKGQGKVLLSLSFDQCDEFIRRCQEGQNKDEFGLTLSASWIEFEEPLS